MNNDPQLRQRTPLRLKRYDYSRPGAYFVTVCVQRRACLFGDVVDSKVVANEAGRMVRRVWKEMQARFPGVIMDEFIAMPNHVHGIVVITDKGAEQGAFSLGSVLGAFKSLTTGEYIRGVESEGWRPFDGRLWQRNYYEHVVRDEQDLVRVTDYISINAERWSEDLENPQYTWRTGDEEKAIQMRERR